uniref:C2H2-type domain-containing protein n=1 Tax=Euplotes crassus TaxID=5936 RepID=A0A7S3KJ73_EUPCR|mmetsp:Transcript_25553/g.25347  ORF Transcript_25553/g.25347 Transcript_25553/m.25347 type:complete len:104 (+) Transcript_25553:95-406(+)
MPKPKVRFYCTYPNCGKAFRKELARDKHQGYHYKERAHKCHICSKSYTQNGNLIKHLKTHFIPNVDLRKTHRCEYCSRRYTEKYNLKVHQKKFHPAEYSQTYE